MAGCFDNSTGVILSPESSCPLGYFCPNIKPAATAANSSILATYPTFCHPSTECAITRLLGGSCFDSKTANAGPQVFGAQGLYEPVVCPPGYYCPTTSSILLCPSGYFCPTGTFAPHACDSLASCPKGSTTQTSFTGVVAFLIIDFLLALVYIGLWYADRKKLQSLDILPIAVKKQESEKQVIQKSEAHESPASPVVFDFKDVPDNLPRRSVVKSPNSPISDERQRKSMMIKNILASNFKSSMNGKDLRMHFEMDQLGYKLPSGKEVLKGVTGRIQDGKMTAIMGPSGAGKTTFMNVLCGKVNRTSGTLKISGRVAELQAFKKICGFVPQEDVMHRELSVRENILHSARIRAPKSWTAAQVESHVDGVIQALNLSHVAHTLIGDGITRGVSGGQRKRVNIGMEVAATPLCIFLDEPTSGLDSTSSLEVMDMLNKISEIGMTVVAVIHQPRAEIFTKFHEVLMVAPGGRTAYLGPTVGARPYFEKLGYQFPIGTNDADILMDIISGHGKNDENDISVDGLVEHWNKHYMTVAEEEERVKKEKGPEWALKLANADDEFHNLAKELVKERGANLFKQIYYVHNLSIVQQYRTIPGFVLEVFVAAFAGLLLGLSLSGLPETYTGLLQAPFTSLSTAPNTWLTVQLSMLVGMGVALAAAPAGVKIFSEELPIYWRNVSSGHSPGAYFIAKVFSTSYRMALGALHFSSIIYYLATPVISFGDYFISILLMFYGVYGLASFVSMLVRRENATLLAVVFALFSAVFCGYGLTLKKVKDWGIFFIWAMQFNMWSAEANWSLTLKIYEHLYDNPWANSGYGYTLNNIAVDYGYMFLIGSIWRLLAFLAMIFMNRDKQK